MIKHAVAGIPVDDETLAVEDIAGVGPFGDFLSLDATLRHMRALSQPEVLDRRVREDWEARGASDLADARASSRPGAHRHPRTAAARPGRRQADPRHHRGRRPREGRGMKDELKQAIIAGDAGTVNALTAGPAGHGRLAPRDPRRGPPARHGGGRRAHAKRRLLHPRGAASAQGRCRAPSTSCARTWRRARAPAPARS